MSGPSHHYLPAAFIGRFSENSSGSLRDRSVWYLKIGTDSAQQVVASNIGCEDNLYKLFGVQNQDAEAVDDIWSEYEQRLNPALDELSNPKQKTIAASTWLRVLVPFVTGLFVRGKEFGPRYEARLKSAGFGKAGPFTNQKWMSDNTNNSRLIEFQRLLAPVMSARWVVMHTKGNHPIVTNELGFTIFQPPDGSNPGIAIPIGKTTILGIIRTWPKHGRMIMQDGGTGQWRAIIEHRDLAENDQKNFNEAMANFSNGFIAGPSQSSVELHAQALNNSLNLKPETVEAFWPDSLVRVAHELEWYRAVSLIAKKSSDIKSIDLQKIEWNQVAKGWSPFVILPANLKDFPTGMIIQGNRIGLSMTQIPGFTDGTKNSPYILLPRDV